MIITGHKAARATLCDHRETCVRLANMADRTPVGPSRGAAPAAARLRSNPPAGLPPQAVDSPLLAPTLNLLDGLGPLPDDITVHLDAGYDSGKTRTTLDERGLRGRIAHQGERAPVQATVRWHVERTHACQNAFHRLARCYERRIDVINAFFDLTDAVISVRRLIRRAWTTHRWDDRPTRRP